MNKLWSVLLMAAFFAGVAGCTSLAPPNFSNPGPAEYQQSQAQRFDPYPEIEPAPEIVGARPLEYEKPPDEVFFAPNGGSPINGEAGRCLRVCTVGSLSKPGRLRYDRCLNRDHSVLA